jgi:hypothetical protein
MWRRTLGPVKDLGWLAVGIALVAQSAVSCTKEDCDPEVENTPAGKIELMTCTVLETCDGVTTRKVFKFRSEGGPVANAAECGRYRGAMRTDCSYEVEIENLCIPRETKRSDGPTIIFGSAAVSTGYGDTDTGYGGAGGT